MATRSLPVYQEQEIDDANKEPCTECVFRPMWGTVSGCIVSPLRRYSLVSEKEVNQNEPVDLLIVADAPTEADGKKDKFFSDTLGKEVLRRVQRMGLTTFAIIPAVRCHPKGDVDYNVLTKKYKEKPGQKSRYTPKPTPLELANKAVVQCSEYVTRALVDYRPKLTLAMGSLATSALGLGGNVNNLRTHPFRKKRGLKRLSSAEGTLITVDRFRASFSETDLRALKRDLDRVSFLRKTSELSKRGSRKNIKHVTLDTVPKVKGFVDFVLTHKWKEPTLLALDFESENLDLNVETNKVLNVGFSFSCDEDTAFVVPLWHSGTPFTNEELGEVREQIARLFATESELAGWIAHAAQAEQSMAKLFFGTYIGGPKNPMIDTQLLAFLYDENRKGSIHLPYSLETLCGDYLGFLWYGQSDIKKKRDRLAFEPMDVVNDYVGIDAVMTVRLLLEILDMMKDNGSLEDSWRLARKLYAEGIEYVTDMRLTGQAQNRDLLRNLRRPDSVVQQRMQELEDKFMNSEAVAETMEILSEKKGSKGAKGQMKKRFSANRKVLFNTKALDHWQTLFCEVMGIEGAAYSVDKAFQDDHEHIPEVVEFAELRKLHKLDGTYLKPIANWLQHPNCVFDGRLRPYFSLLGAKTGRLSCSDPNTQNVPTRGSIRVAKQIKALTEAELGNVLVQLDFSQAEVRWLGIMASDENLAAKYRRAKEVDALLKKDPNNKELQRLKKVEGDLHRSTAIQMYNLDLSLLDTDPDFVEVKRQAAKSICFGLIYGKTAESLAMDLGVPVEQMREDIDKWLAQFPQAREFLNQLESDARTLGYVRSPFGRRRHLPEARSNNRSVANRAARQARNTPIQSAASDCCMYAAAKLRRALAAHPDPRIRAIKLVNTVHDSVVAEVMQDADVIQMYCELAQEIFTDENMLMEDFGVPITVPLAVDFEIGANWANMRPYVFTEETMNAALYDADKIRGLPPGSLFKDRKDWYNDVKKEAAIAA